MTKKKSAPRVKRIPKPVLAMAAPPSETPVVTIDRLKGGEMNWSVRVPARSLPMAVNRAVAEARRLDALLAGWRKEQEAEKSTALAAALAASAKGSGQ